MTYVERKAAEWHADKAATTEDVIRSVIEDCAREALESVRDKDEGFAEVGWALDAAARIRALASPGGRPIDTLPTCRFCLAPSVPGADCAKSPDGVHGFATPSTPGERPTCGTCGETQRVASAFGAMSAACPACQGRRP